MFTGLRERLRALEKRPRKSMDPDGFVNLAEAVRRELGEEGFEDFLNGVIAEIEADGALIRMQTGYA